MWSLFFVPCRPDFPCWLILLTFLIYALFCKREFARVFTHKSRLPQQIDAILHRRRSAQTWPAHTLLLLICQYLTMVSMNATRSEWNILDSTFENLIWLYWWTRPKWQYHEFLSFSNYWNVFLCVYMLMCLTPGIWAYMPAAINLTH